jgi:hypothetical protein
MATPVTILIAVGIATLSAWIAWRYSRLPLSQDEGLWMLWGFTGSRPYLDHVDCKPPGVHLWCWFLARVTRFDPSACRLIHQGTLGAIAITAYLLSGNASVALAFIVVTQSAWFEGYFAWVETMSAGLWLLAVYAPPGVAVGCLVLACLFNLKLFFPALAFTLLHGWFVEVAAAIAVVALMLLVIRFAAAELARGLWYGCVVVPRRMVAARTWSIGRQALRLDVDFLVPLLLVGTLAFSGASHRLDMAVWAGGAVYIGVNAAGKVWRPYHWIPLAPMLASAAPPIALAIAAVDLMTNRLYLGNVVSLRRPMVGHYLVAALRIGRTICRNAGRLWVYGQFTQLYIYARARPALLPVEQVEIRHVIPEQREAATVQDVDTIVICPAELKFLPKDFRVILREDGFMVLERERREG